MTLALMLMICMFLRHSSLFVIVMTVIMMMMMMMMSGQFIRICRWHVWRVYFSTQCTCCAWVHAIPLGSVIMPQLVGFLASSSTSLLQSSCPPSLLQLEKGCGGRMEKKWWFLLCACLRIHRWHSQSAHPTFYPEHHTLSQNMLVT